jgi:hypothetical protein
MEYQVLKDILPNILNNIIDVDTYKSINLTSKLFYLTMYCVILYGI